MLLSSIVYLFNIKTFNNNSYQADFVIYIISIILDNNFNDWFISTVFLLLYACDVPYICTIICKQNLKITKVTTVETT